MRHAAIIIVLFSMLVPMVLLSAVQTVGADGSDPKFKIIMVLWRGITKADQGFINYLDDHDIADPDEITIMDCEKEAQRLPGIIRTIKKQQPSLVYTFGTTVTTAVAGAFDSIDPMQHITTIPIVFNIVSKPVQARIIPDFSSSQRNITGVSHLVPMDSQIRAMRSVMTFNKLGVIYNPMEKNSVLQIDELHRLSKTFDFELINSPLGISSSGDLEAGAPEIAVDMLANNGCELIYLPSDSLLISIAEQVVRRSQHHRIPTFSATEGPIRKAGALMGLVSNYYSAGQFAGYKARQILMHGHKAAQIPVQTLDKFSFVINMQSARELQVFPPIGIFRFAEVINPLRDMFEEAQ